MKRMGSVAYGLTLGALLLLAPALTPSSICKANPAQQLVSWADQLQPPQPRRATEKTTFTGRIAESNNGKFVLQDSSTNASFFLDDQQKASSFNGKTVRVTGTLDPSSTVIHVIEIEAV
jgi:hypothetical protein